MRVTYLKLENVAGLYVGSNINSIEIDFTKAKNKITCIVGKNGDGKSCLISTITPFAYVTSLDDRSSISFILPKKNGYKEIHYKDDQDEYIIKHYFKATKDTHSVKSYFMKNGEELNENGNVSSFNSLVELHFGLTQEMMRLIRIGTNVNSFVTLTPARRKEYIGKLIQEIELYINIHKKINGDLKVVKTLLQTNNNNLYNCHIDDPVIKKQELSDINKEIKRCEKDRDGIISKIGKVNALMSNNDIHDIRRKYQEAESAVNEFEKLSNEIVNNGLENVSLDQLIIKRNDLSNQKIDTQSKINSLRISIDNIMNNIERLEISIKKITANNDIQSLMNAINNLRSMINDTPSIVKTFKPIGATSQEVYDILSRLQSFNQISQMIFSLGDKPLKLYIKMKIDHKDVSKWLREQSKKRINRINSNDLRMLVNKIFDHDDIIGPNCGSDQFTECPYYRLSEELITIRDELNEELQDEETLRSMQIIDNNISNILNELDHYLTLLIPEKIKIQFKEKSMLERLDSHLPFFDLTNLQEYLSIQKEYEIYTQNYEKLNQYQQQLSVYKNAGINQYTQEINNQKELIEKYHTDIKVLDSSMNDISIKLNKVDNEISLVSKYNDSKKYQNVFISTLNSTKKILEPLETASQEKMELEFQLKHITNGIEMKREEYRSKENTLNEYERLIKEGKKLTKINTNLNTILEAVSTKKGIPVIYMKHYLDRIQKLSNQLLDLIYDGELTLAPFNVTPETFEVPYIKNGKMIPDIKYGSQSEIALTTMALSFALANNVSGSYNILLLDEIDAGLDDANRAAFLKMLYMQMNTLHAEQVFIISHNLSHMANIPMDCIKLSDTGIRNRLQNIIYE